MPGSSNSVLLRVGGVITRVMLSRPLRSSRLARWAYAQMYLLGKTLSEKREREFLGSHLTPGMTVVDIGANIGFYTAFFSGQVGGAGRVYAFEPDPYCFDILETRAGGFPEANVVAVPLALGEHEGRVRLYGNPANRADNRTNPIPGVRGGEQVEVRRTSLDAWCEEQRIGRIDAVKMDVQGAEVSVLRGMPKLMASGRPKWMWVEFSPADLRAAGSCPAEFWDTLRHYDYTPMVIDDSSRLQPISSHSAFTEEVGDWYTNIFAVSGVRRA